MRVPLAVLVATLVVCANGRAWAQAWPAPAGTGAVSLSTQVIENTGHRLSDGYLAAEAKSRNVSVLVDVDYAISDRWSVSAGLPFVFARYLGPDPTRANLPPDACRCWNSGVQDLSAAVSFAVLDGPIGLTASVGGGRPSHDYEWRGEAVVGFGLHEVRAALEGGIRLDAISPRLAVLGRYQYAVVENIREVPDIGNNRSNWSTALSVAVTPRLGARVTVNGQRTHGGLRAGSPTLPGFPPPGDLSSVARDDQHDRLMRNNYVHLGGTLSYSLPRLDLFVAYRHFVQGTDSHAGRAFTTGVSWPFQR